MDVDEPRGGALMAPEVFTLRDRDGTEYRARDVLDWRLVAKLDVAGIRFDGGLWLPIGVLLKRYRQRRRKDRRNNAAKCPCHDVRHAKCPGAKPCIGGCGRLTTPFESSACGYCIECSADPRWQVVS